MRRGLGSLLQPPEAAIREGIQILLTVNEDLLKTYLILPISLQVLLENAVKHNKFSVKEPLEVRLTLEPDMISVNNEVRRKNASNVSSKVGLKNLDERYQLIMQEGIRIDSTGSHFTVILPLLKTARGVGKLPSGIDPGSPLESHH